MNTLLTITRNTFRQTLRQPVFGLIVLATLGSLAMAPSVTGWTLDDDNKLLRDLGLSTLLAQGLFLAAFSAAGVVSAEIEDKTVMTVVAKPVRRGVFLLGKYGGLLAALLLAHYLAILALLMTLRHGVLQTSADKPDLSVIIAGPGMMLLVMLVAALLNYLFDWRFLSTTVGLGVVGLSLGAFTLLFIDRDFKFRTYQISQDIPGLPAEVDPARDFAGVITYEDVTEPGALTPAGKLYRSEWLGPIPREERNRLLALSDDPMYRMCVDFLVDKSRDLVTPQIVKAAVTLVGVLAVLAGFCIAVSTRLSAAWTLMLALVLLCAGLVSDHFLAPLTQADHWWRPAASVAYHLLPNIQFFWLIDAIAQENPIPVSYVLACLGYAFTYSLGLLAIAAALFETREVG